MEENPEISLPDATMEVVYKALTWASDRQFQKLLKNGGVEATVTLRKEVNSRYINIYKAEERRLGKNE